MDQLYPEFKNHILKSCLIQAKDNISVAFSGGKDSTALLLLLLRLREEIDFSLQAAYYNHQIRPDYPQEEKWVREFCQNKGVELLVSRKKVKDFARREKLNLEKAAAISRYDFFRKLIIKHKNIKIATAHTRSDLCETYFIKLLRGSGLEGLASIYETFNSSIIRPILIFSQETVLSFLKRNNYPYFKDPSNENINFLRNNMRKNLIPSIKKIEPRIEEHIYNTVSIIKAELDYFKKLAGEFLDQTLILQRVLPVKSINKLPVALQRHVLREYIRLIKGDLQNITFNHIENILKNMQATAGVCISGVELSFKKGFIFPRQLSLPAYRYTLKKSTKRLHIKEIDKTILLKKVKNYQKPADNFSIIIPFHKVKFPFCLRSPQRKDEYFKINAAYKQKIFESIRVSGYPDKLRNLLPLIEDQEGNIIWVAASPLADLYKVEDEKKGDFLKIEYI